MFAQIFARKSPRFSQKKSLDEQLATLQWPVHLYPIVHSMPSQKSWQIWHPPKTLAKEVWERLQIEYDACCNVMGQCSLHKLKLDCELILLPCSPTSKVIVIRCPEPKPVISISMWLCSGAMVTLESLQQYMFKILFTLSKETGNPAFILSISYTDIQLFRVVKWSMNFWENIFLYSSRTSWQKVRDKPLHISERRNVLILGNN